jgi:hypothetical protein
MSDINILFITFYGLIEYIADIVNEFDSHKEKLSMNGIELSIHDIPYLHYQNTEQMKLIQILELINNIIRSKKITHIFWFFYPDDITIMKNIKLMNPNTKTIFYNFDDPKSFTVDLVRKSKYIDYFINPSIISIKKYTYIMDRYIHFIPMYIHKDLLLNYANSTFGESDSDTKSDLYSLYKNMNINNKNNSDDEFNNKIINESISHSDNSVNDSTNNIINISNSITIFLDDDYLTYNNDEKVMFRKYIKKIKDFFFETDYDIKLYGNSILENEYQDIYEDSIDILIEGQIIMESEIIIIIDVKMGLDKKTNSLISHCMIYNKPLMTNSNQINNITSILTGMNKQNNITIFDLDNVDTSLEKVINNELVTLEPDIINTKINNTILSINEWVGKIISIIK